MNRSEAGKLGAAKSKLIQTEKHKRFVEDYNSNPKQCRLCSAPIRFDKRRNNFCGHSCAAAYVNGRRGANIKSHPCLVCGKEILTRKTRKLCSIQCRGRFLLLKTFAKIRQGEYKSTWSGNPSLKKFLIESRGYICEECKLTEWQGKPIPLNTHHLDGDASNNHPTNIKLLCLNCHGLTENYGAKNNNSTRKYRYVRP